MIYQYEKRDFRSWQPMRKKAVISLIRELSVAKRTVALIDYLLITLTGFALMAGFIAIAVCGGM